MIGAVSAHVGPGARGGGLPAARDRASPSRCSAGDRLLRDPRTELPDRRELAEHRDRTSRSSSSSRSARRWSSSRATSTSASARSSASAPTSPRTRSPTTTGSPLVAHRAARHGRRRSALGLVNGLLVVVGAHPRDHRHARHARDLPRHRLRDHGRREHLGLPAAGQLPRTSRPRSRSACRRWPGSRSPWRSSAPRSCAGRPGGGTSTRSARTRTPHASPESRPGGA